MLVYDVEVYKHYWVVGIADLKTQQFLQIEDNLLDFFNKHYKDLWIGFNNVHYDQWIFKAILLGKNPYELSQHLIDGGNAWSYSRSLYEIDMYNFDIGDKFHSLKQLEGFMGESIQECSVPFDLDRALTDEEKEEVKRYNRHDVEQTIKVLKHKFSDFICHKDLIETFNLSMNSFSKTKARLTAEILSCKSKKFNDETEFDILDCIEIKKYKDVVDWFKTKECLSGKKLVTEIAGINHTFGLGGLHAGDKITCKNNLLHLDVQSFYPTIMIYHNLLSRAVINKSKYEEIYKTRLRLKREGKKKEQLPYKTLLNSTYGICKDKYNAAFDIRRANEICINGQLLLLDLIEHIEEYCTLIQSNTDGIIVSYKDYEKLKFAYTEWENRTHMKLEEDALEFIIQKDVNNYITDIERKGSYVKELNFLDYDLPIVNKAICDYFTKNIPVEETINCCDELIKFQKIVKIGSMYEYCNHNCIEYHLKVYRVFASKSVSDGPLLKKKKSKYTLDKVGNTPDKLFIDNGDIKNKTVPAKLDKSWYINLAKKRIGDMI